MSDEDDTIRLLATDFTVSASEKVSTGEYENYNPHITIEGKIPLADDLDDEGRQELKQKLLDLHGDLQEVLDRSAGNRLAVPEHEDWSFDEEETDQEAGDE